MRNVGKQRCRDCDADGMCVRTSTHPVRTADGTTVASHDSYGNPYRNHICCTCGGRKWSDCFHRAGLQVQLMQDHTQQGPMVVCMSCGFRWTSIPADTRIHSGMFDVLADAFDVYFQSQRDPLLRQRCVDIMNQYLDWRPASEKQDDWRPT